jgi:lysophospholipase L1-like esterase
MPLGDSITMGFSSGAVPDNSDYYISYRLALRDSLVSADYEIDYVGSLTSGGAVLSDPQHEGHPGWRADQLAASIYGWLQDHPADVILLHIGTNDLGNPNNTSADNVKNLLDEIDRYEDNHGVAITVVLARIINTASHTCPDGSYTTTFNNNVEAMALDRVNNQNNPAYPDKIVMVDMECGAGLDYIMDTAPPYTHDMYDFLHPNQNGYEKMADVWLEGLREILPVANPGPDQNVNPGDTVMLDGSGSTDTLGTIISYEWRQTGGSPEVTLINAAAEEASFTAPATQTGATLTFELSITDDKGFAHKASCAVNVNGAPTADAGPDQRVNPGAFVVLDGSDSIDPDGSIVSYAWVQVGGEPAVNLINAKTSRAAFTAPAVGSNGALLTFRLTVSDDLRVQSSDMVNIQINGPPVANAGPDHDVQSGVDVTLDGSGSTDEGGGDLVYAWVQISGPAVVLSSPASLRPSFQAPSVGSTTTTLTFLLTVTDNGGLQAQDSCTVTVTPEGGPSRSGSGGGGCFITAAGQ